MSGFVKIHRSMNKWEWKKKPLTFALFVHLIMNANHKNGRFQGHEIKRGQIVTGRKELALETGLTEQSVRTALKHLKSTNEITIETTNNFSIITVLNYEKYQDSNQPSNQRLTNNQPTTNHNTKKERKKEGKNTARPADVSESVWDDFQKIRKAKRAPVTETAIKKIRVEAEKINWPLEKALQECCARGWQGFEADWIKTKKRTLGYTPLGVGG